jgi:hypothetical protein
LKKIPGSAEPHRIEGQLQRQAGASGLTPSEPAEFDGVKRHKGRHQQDQGRADIVSHALPERRQQRTEENHAGIFPARQRRRGTEKGGSNHQPSRHVVRPFHGCVEQRARQHRIDHDREVGGQKSGRNGVGDQQ